MPDQSRSWQQYAPERLRDFMDRKRLQAEIEKIDAKFQPLLDAAPNDAEEHHIQQAWNCETDELQEELARLLGRRIEIQARRLGVDIPEECWTESKFERYRYIGYRGQAKLRRAIRDARREAVRWWVQVIVMPLIALFSSFVALVSLLWRVK